MLKNKAIGLVIWVFVFWLFPFETTNNQSYQYKNMNLHWASIVNTTDNTKNIDINIPSEYEREIKDIINEFPNDLFASLKKIQYKPDSQRRWLASDKTIYLNFDKIQTQSELRRVFIHELWHIFDLWYLKSKEKKIKTKYKDWSNQIYADDPSIKFYSLCWKTENKQNWECSNEDFVSKYSQSDMFEDFAESFLLYIENNESFKIMAKESDIMEKKYNIIKSYLKFIPTTWAYSSQQNLEREWDLTILN